MRTPFQVRMGRGPKMDIQIFKLRNEDGKSSPVPRNAEDGQFLKVLGCAKMAVPRTPEPDLNYEHI